MKVTLHKEPFHFILVDDTYDKFELALIWKELDFLISADKLHGGDGTGTATDMQGNVLKSNKGIFLEHVYLSRDYSNILTANRKLFMDGILRPKDSWFFSTQKYDYDSTLISYYEDGDYYRPHQDDVKVTACTWFWKEPKLFTGGNLFFPDYDIQIEIQNNSTILFPSHVRHAVENVKMDEKDKGKGHGRICMSQFINYENGSKQDPPKL